MALKQAMLLGGGGAGVELGVSELIYEIDGRREGLKYGAIEGCTAAASTLVVHTFPLRSGCMGGPKRTQVDVAIPCASEAQAQERKAALLESLSGGTSPLPRRHLLVLVNPFSGRRQGRANLNATRHILAMRGATLEEVETTHAGHAEEMMLALDLGRYDGIVIVSGDGLM